MKPISFPTLTLPDPDSGVAPTLGHRLVDGWRSECRFARDWFCRSCVSLCAHRSAACAQLNRRWYVVGMPDHRCCVARPGL